MGSIDKYCPHCGSEKVYTVEMTCAIPGTELEFTNGDALWYECGDCHSEWEPHRHHATHTNYGTA